MLKALKILQLKSPRIFKIQNVLTVTVFDQQPSSIVNLPMLFFPKFLINTLTFKALPLLIRTPRESESEGLVFLKIGNNSYRN